MVERGTFDVATQCKRQGVSQFRPKTPTLLNRWYRMGERRSLYRASRSRAMQEQGMTRQTQTHFI